MARGFRVTFFALIALAESLSYTSSASDFTSVLPGRTSIPDIVAQIEQYCNLPNPGSPLSDCNATTFCQSLVNQETCNLGDNATFAKFRSALKRGQRPHPLSGASEPEVVSGPEEVSHLRASSRSYSLDDELKACTEDRRDAEDCCDDPIKCMTGGRLSKNNKNAIEAIAGIILPQISNPDNIQKICVAQQGMAVVSGAINVLAINNCERARNRCADSCKDIRDKAEAAYKQIESNPNGQGNGRALDRWSDIHASAENSLYTCRGFSDNTAALTLETIGNISRSGT